jgi:hypothetical protein
MQADRENGKIGWACGEFEPLLVLFAAGELDSAEQARVAAHLAHCSGCAAEFESENQLLGLLAENHVEPGASLLASCRANLLYALDLEEGRSWFGRTAGALLPASWLAPRPAWGAAILLFVGFSVGMFGPRLLRHSLTPASPPDAIAESPAASGAADTSAPVASPVSTLDLHTAEVAGINVYPSGENQPPQVELQLNAQQPMTVHGTVDNGDVKRVLLYVLRNNQRYDPDVRLDAVDLLRARNNDPEVRSALCHAVHTDNNAAVRLKALEALNGAEPQDIVRQTLLDALVDDRNPGVRVEAINELRSMAANGQVSSDNHMLAVLRERMQKDPNTYIRLQSAAAIRDLGPRAKF